MHNNSHVHTYDPCRSETPENFITKVGHFDYVVRSAQMCPLHK